MIISIEPTKDNFLTNKVLNSGGDLATGSNMGLASAGMIYHYSGSANPTLNDKIENSRIIMEFDISTFSNFSNIGFNSASASYTLKMYDAPVQEFLPGGFTLYAHRISGTFAEGNGFDLQALTDYGASNWTSSSIGSPWTSQGGDYYSVPTGSQLFSIGYENLEMDVTSLVTSAISSGSTTVGILLKLSDAVESGSSPVDPKVFYTRHTSQALKRPRLIAKNNGDIVTDYRGGLTPGYDSSIYMYFTPPPSGQFGNIPDYVSGSFLTSSNVMTVLLTSSIGWEDQFQADWIKTGFYKTNIFVPFSGTIVEHLNNSGSITIQDFWYRNSDDYLIHDGEIKVIKPANSNFDAKNYRVSVKNLKEEYDSVEVPALQVFVFDVEQNRKPAYTPEDSNSVFIEDLRYEVRDSETGALIIEDSEYTKTSVSLSGNYFYFPMTNLEYGRVYEFNFFANMYGQKIKLNKNPQKFKIKMPVTPDGN